MHSKWKLPTRRRSETQINESESTTMLNIESIRSQTERDLIKRNYLESKIKVEEGYLQQEAMMQVQLQEILAVVKAKQQ